MEDKQRYLRLQLLLDKSEIYCKFLQERMEKQRVDAQKHQERMAKKEEKQKRQDANSTQQVWEQFLFFTLFLYFDKIGNFSWSKWQWFTQHEFNHLVVA